MARTVITPPPRIAIPDFKQLWEGREVLIRFGTRDITLRYRQTALGVIWVVLQPLLTALVFTLVFNKVAKLPSGKTPYLAFSFSGLLMWNLFSGVLSRGSGALVGNAALVSKVFFPRVLVPLSVTFSALVDFGVSLGMMVVLLISYKIWPGWQILLLPVWVALVLLLAGGLGTVLSGLTVRFRDVQYVVPFMLQFLLYASPIGYSVSAVPRKYRLIYDCNPLSWLLNEFRWSLIGGSAPPAWQISGSVVAAIGVFGICMLLFEQMERGLADLL